VGSRKKDGTNDIKWRVRNKQILLNSIIPIIDTYPFITVKQ